MMQVAYVVVWWLALGVVGLVSFPLVSRICGALGDRGYSISKLVGLVILTFLVWVISSLRVLPFGLGSIGLSFAILTALSLWFGRRHVKPSTWPRKPIIISESVFALSFVAFLLIMFGKPDIYFGGADFFMDYAFMGSILRGGYFPPVDPWFAGEGLSYYYGGHLVAAIFTTVTRVPPSIAFNIAVAMFFGLAVVASHGLGFNLTRRGRYGLVAALFVCIVGFLTGAYQLVGHLFDTDILGASHIAAPSIMEWTLNFDFWSAPWLIPYAMAQYPYYLFLAGTLHAFMMSIPFHIMFLTLVYGVFQRSRSCESWDRVDTYLDIAVLGLSLGFFSIVNTWDYPVFAALAVAAFVLLRIRRSVRGTIAVLAAIIVVSIVAYVPYYVSSGMGGVGWFGVVSDRTDLSSFLEALAPFLFFAFSLLVVLRKPETVKRWRGIGIIVVLLAATIAVALIVHVTLLIVLAPLILLPLYYIVRASPKTEREYVLLLIIMAASLALFCELVYIDDCYGPPWERFNTVFKLYVPLWVSLGLASAYAVFYVMQRVRKWVKIPWLVLAVLLVLGVLVHPVVSTVSACSGRHTGWGLNRGTLDGIAYLETIEKGDYDAIRWINREIRGHPVVLEAPGAVFTYTSRIATFTGLPTLIGWTSWEVMWRGDWAAVEEREKDANAIYSTLDDGEALSLLCKYEVEYVYVGRVEKEMYEAGGLQKFGDQPQTYQPVYDEEGVTIYRVRRGEE
ncbi:MAG: DUF2298 domain-containing protein [Chloroflexota bacterium]